jgi:Flavodoxins
MYMKNLIAYYSWTENTKVLAEEIQKLTGGTLKRIEEIKQRKSGSGFGGAAFAALIGMKS